MVGKRRGSEATGARGRIIGALVAGGAALAATLCLPWPALLVPAALAVVLLARWEPRQLSALFHKWLLLGLFLTIIVPVWLVGAPDKLEVRSAGTHSPPGEMNARREGSTAALVAGAAMAVRAVATFAVMLLISGSLTPASVSRWLGRIVGRELALACAIGVNLLPAIIEILRRTTLAMRLRGGFSHRRLGNLKRLLTSVGVQTVRLTEDVTESLLLAHPPAPSSSEREHESGDAR